MTNAHLDTAAAEELSHCLSHIAAPQGVNDRVKSRVEDGKWDAKVSTEKQHAVAGDTEKVHQQQQEERPPADHEDNHDGDNRLKQSQGALASALGARLCALVDMAIDGTIEHTDSDEDDKKDDKGEQNVGLGVKRQKGGAGFQAANTVPSQQRQEAYGKREDPAEDHQEEHPVVTLAGWLLLKRFHHGCVALHGDEQQTEYGRSQSHKKHSLPEEPQGRAQAKWATAGQADVDHIGGASEEVTQRDVGNADINPASALADAGDDSDQHEEVLQGYENTEKEDDGHRGSDVVLATGDRPVLEAAGVVIMQQDHMVQLCGCGTVRRGVDGIGYIAGVTEWVVHVRARCQVR